MKNKKQLMDRFLELEGTFGNVNDTVAFLNLRQEITMFVADVQTFLITSGTKDPELLIMIEKVKIWRDGLDESIKNDWIPPMETDGDTI